MPKDLHISTLVTALLAILLMVIVPCYNMLHKSEVLIQNYVEYRTEMFTDTIKSSGKVTKTVYEQFIHYLDSTGYIYDVQIEHQKKVIAPNYSEDGVFLGTYTEYYETYHVDDIRDAIYATGEYLLTFGDYVTVSVTSRTPAKSSNVTSIFLGRGATLADYIRYTDGGLVWNEAY